VIAGVPVRVTSVAKTIADCFKFRSSVTVTVAYEALKNAWAQRRVTSSDLVYFAKKDRVYNIMRPYLDTLS
jgi:predicted transcriptional regulator of viral defense system